MPPSTTIRHFINALKSGRTNITEALDGLFNDPAFLATYPQFATANFDAPLPDWARTALSSRNVSSDEIDHIDAWPGKEALRQQVLQALQAGAGLQFFWEVHRGADEENVVAAGAGNTTGTFRSPGNTVRLSFITFGDVQVEPEK